MAEKEKEMVHSYISDTVTPKCRVLTVADDDERKLIDTTGSVLGFLMNSAD